MGEEQGTVFADLLTGCVNELFGDILTDCVNELLEIS